MNRRTMLWIIIVVLVFCFITFITLPNIMEQKQEDIACYKFHLQECNYCHSINKTFGLCSGFCYEPDKKHLEIYCAIHPQEDCKNIPKECNT